MKYYIDSTAIIGKDVDHFTNDTGREEKKIYSTFQHITYVVHILYSKYIGTFM